MVDIHIGGAKNRQYSDDKNGDIHADDVKNVIRIEQQAVQTVTIIKSFIDALRETTKNHDTTRKGKTSRNQSGNNNDNRSSLPVALYSWMMTQETIVSQVHTLQMMQSKQQETQQHHKHKETILPTNLNTSQEKRALLKEIILPLIRSLTKCYQILDQIPSNNASNNNMVPTNQTMTNKRSNKSSSRPPPPRGMLSLQQYTDIACLLEFTVCTMILPYLDTHILTSIDDRIHHQLPKSLAGRIPIQCLTWGKTLVRQYHRNDSKNDDKTKNNMNENNDTKNIIEMDVHENDKLFFLKETSTAIAALVSLDRFCPMLLPRHIADIYAAQFQYEQSYKNISNHIIKDAADKGDESFKDDAIINERWSMIRVDDDILNAKAYQTLLLQGSKSPLWLRKRVGSLLSNLAGKNLAAIIQVFVPLQQGEVSTMATQRLGRTLATTATTENDRKIIVQQIRFLLQAIFPTIVQGQIPIRGVAMIQTIWAILIHWSVDFVERELVQHWEHDLLVAQPERKDKHQMQPQNNRGRQIHATIRQIGSLCAHMPPPTADSNRILSLFLPSIMHALVRVASLKSVVKLNIKDDAIHILNALSTVAGTFPPNLPSTDGRINFGLTTMAASWIHSITPNAWDVQFSYKVTPTTTSESTAVASPVTLDLITIVSVEKETSLPMSLSYITDEIQGRISAFFQTSVTDTGPASLNDLLSRIFQMLLRLYLRGQNSSKTSSGWCHQLVSMVMISPLCEKCSQEILLFGSGKSTDAIGLLMLIRMALLSTQEKLHPETREDPKISSDSSISDSLDANDNLESIFNSFSHNLVNGENIAQTSSFNLERNFQDLHDQQETVFSVCSVLLSLLIALLELGSNKRQEKEEIILKSLLPSLCSLAALNNKGSDKGTNGLEIQSGIADMSGYAMALIASRETDQIQQNSSAVHDMQDKQDRVKAIIVEAQSDLNSSQPPMRARGLVSLGRLARGYLGIANAKEKKTVVIEVHDESERSLAEYMVQEVLRLCVLALQDSESYVYLASIQTIVAIGDFRPKEVLPKVARMLVSGRDGSMDSEGGSLSDEQRIKLAEALIFIIRRRAAPSGYVSLLMNIMIYGSTERIGTLRASDSDEYRDIFAQQTADYFSGSNENTALMQDKKEQWKEMDIRSRTGGPVFTLEEHDILRAARLSVVAELFAVALSSALIPFVPTVIMLIKNSLQLDPSRSVRRTAALLGRNLYGCLVGNRSIDETEESSAMDFAIALSFDESEEESLRSILQVNADGRMEKGSQGTMNDPATRARCQEALIFREQGEDLLLGARLAVAQNASNIPKILSTMVKNQAPNLGSKTMMS